MKIIIFHGHGVNQSGFKKNVFDNWESAELHAKDMLGRGFHICGGTTDCEPDNRLVIAGVRPEGTFITLPLELE